MLLKELKTIVENNDQSIFESSTKDNYEFLDFWSWAMKNLNVEEDDLYDLIDSAYNSDTRTMEVFDEVYPLIKGRKDKPLDSLKAKIIKTIKDKADFTITGYTDTPELKKAKALLKASTQKYAEQYFTFLGKNWDTLATAYKD